MSTFEIVVWTLVIYSAVLTVSYCGFDRFIIDF